MNRKAQPLFPIRTFWYQVLGGETGQVKASTANAAARIAMGQPIAHFASGSALSQPWVFIGEPENLECRIWDIDPLTIH